VVLRRHKKSFAASLMPVHVGVKGSIIVLTL
jgi:hypothetical protein